MPTYPRRRSGPYMATDDHTKTDIFRSLQRTTNNTTLWTVAITVRAKFVVSFAVSTMFGSIEDACGSLQFSFSAFFAEAVE